MNEEAKKKKVSTGMAIAALILNLFVLPGLGSVIAGRKKEGIWQIVLTVVGFALLVVVVGIVLIIIAWIWGLVTAISLIKEAK